MLISGRQGLFDLPAFHAAGKPLEPARRLRLWTDDYSNLFLILK